jgi:hypothetical protein
MPRCEQLSNGNRYIRGRSPNVWNIAHNSSRFGQGFGDASWTLWNVAHAVLRFAVRGEFANLKIRRLYGLPGRAQKLNLNLSRHFFVRPKSADCDRRSFPAFRRPIAGSCCLAGQKCWPNNGNFVAKSRLASAPGTTPLGVGTFLEPGGSLRSRLLARGAGVHVDLHANWHFNDLRCFPGHLTSPKLRRQCRTKRRLSLPRE